MPKGHNIPYKWRVIASPCAIETCEISSQGLKRKHFHQYVFLPEENSANIWNYLGIQEKVIIFAMRYWCRDFGYIARQTMESAIPAKAWRSFLLKTGDVLFPQDSRIQLFIMLKVRILVGILVQGASARRVRIHAFKRVRNGKIELVRAHWRHYRR